MLQKRARTINIENLQAIADPEYGLVHVVGVLQEQFVNGIALGIGGDGLGMLLCSEFCGINVGFASRQQYGIAALNQLHNFRWRLVERNTYRFASREFDRPLVLRNCTLGVFGISSVRQGNGNARFHFCFSSENPESARPLDAVQCPRLAIVSCLHKAG